MDIKFKFSVEVDNAQYANYELQFTTKQNLKIARTNEKAVEILQLLKLFELEMKPEFKPIPLLSKNEH